MQSGILLEKMNVSFTYEDLYSSEGNDECFLLLINRKNLNMYQYFKIDFRDE